MLSKSSYHLRVSTIHGNCFKNAYYIYSTMRTQYVISLVKSVNGTDGKCRSNPAFFICLSVWNTPQYQEIFRYSIHFP